MAAASPSSRTDRAQFPIAAALHKVKRAGDDGQVSNSGQNFVERIAGYTTMIDDQFSEKNLNPATWLPYDWPQWAGRESPIKHPLPAEGRPPESFIAADQQPWLPEIEGDYARLRCRPVASLARSVPPSDNTEPTTRYVSSNNKIPWPLPRRSSQRSSFERNGHRRLARW